MTTTTRTRRGITVAVAASLVALLAACSPSTTSTGTSDLVDSGKEIDAITVALPGSLANLYVGQEAGILNYYIASAVQEGLVSLDASGKVQPGLAESWETPDENTYVFTLRDDAKFQNGDPVTAEDVAFSLTVAADAELSPSLSWYLANLASVEATGEHEVTVTTTAPDQAFIKNLTTAGSAFITEKSFWEANDGAVGTSESLLLGTGPYKVTEFQPDSHVTLERVDTWWGGIPKVKTITVEFIPDENTRLLAAQAGDVDIAFNVPLSQVDQWEKTDGLRVESVNDLSYAGLFFDLSVAPFDDPKVREAIAHSIDKDAIVDRLLRGHAEAATSLITPESIEATFGAKGAREELASITQYDFDLTAAKKALAQSDSPDGFTAELTYPSTGPQLGTAAQAIAENLAKIGITLTVKELPIETWLATIGDGEHGVNFMWYFSTTGDPAEIPAYLIGPGNPAGFESEEAAALLAKASAETDPEKRAALLIQLEEISATEIVNLPLWWGQSITAFSNKIGINDFSPFTFLSSWGNEIFSAQ